jgi:hypothetical protein
MPPAVFEPAVPASERQQTHALDRAATGIDTLMFYRRRKRPRYQFYLGCLGTSDDQDTEGFSRNWTPISQPFSLQPSQCIDWAIPALLQLWLWA